MNFPDLQKSVSDLMATFAEERLSLRSQIERLKQAVADANAAADQRNQLLQVAVILLGEVSVGHLDEDTMRMAADLVKRISALGGKR